MRGLSGVAKPRSPRITEQGGIKSMNTICEKKQKRKIAKRNRGTGSFAKIRGRKSRAANSVSSAGTKLFGDFLFDIFGPFSRAFWSSNLRGRREVVRVPTAGTSYPRSQGPLFLNPREVFWTNYACPPGAICVFFVVGHIPFHSRARRGGGGKEGPPRRAFPDVAIAPRKTPASETSRASCSKEKSRQTKFAPLRTFRLA